MTPGNERAGISIADPKTYAERAKVAEQSCTLLKLSLPCVVDGIDNAVNTAYSAWPDRLYIIDAQGKIAVMGGQGPGGFAPSLTTAREWLAKIPGKSPAPGR